MAAGSESGFQFVFGTRDLILRGVDVNTPAIDDLMPVDVDFGECRVIEWDGFEFFDRGTQPITAGTIVNFVLWQPAKLLP